MEEDEEMAAAVAGEGPVALREEGAIEAYTEARQEQLKQMEELKAKVIGWLVGVMGVGWFGWSVGLGDWLGWGGVDVGCVLVVFIVSVSVGRRSVCVCGWCPPSHTHHFTTTTNPPSKTLTNKPSAPRRRRWRRRGWGPRPARGPVVGAGTTRRSGGWGT